MNNANQIKAGDEIFIIESYRDNLYVHKKTVEYISKKGRLMCKFRAIKPESLNKFNQVSVRRSLIDEDKLNVFMCYSLKHDLDKNIELFRKRFKKLCGYELPKDWILTN